MAALKNHLEIIRIITPIIDPDEPLDTGESLQALVSAQ